MPPASIWQVFEGASPYVVITFAVLTLIYMFLKHREKMKTGCLETKIDKIDDMLVEHVTLTKDSLNKAKREVDLLEKMCQELVRLGAFLSGEYISTDNSKRIINYQWNWCRDQTGRVIQNSLEHNHFMSHEDLVVRRVRRAWHKISEESRESVKRFTGLKYPFESLYDVHLPMIWERIWEWAVPMYHAMNPRGPGSVEQYQDLQDRITTLFNSVIETYFDMMEDVNAGQFYEPEDPRRSSGAFTLQEEEDAAQRMVQSLLDYGSHISNAERAAEMEDIPCEMRRRQSETDRVKEQHLSNDLDPLDPKTPRDLVDSEAATRKQPAVRGLAQYSGDPSRGPAAGA